MSQLPLRLRSILSYRVDNFIWHHGLLPLSQFLTSSWEQQQFYPVWITGVKRSGKTHLAFVLREELNKKGFFCELLTEHNLDYLIQVSGDQQMVAVMIDDFRLMLPIFEKEPEKFITLYDQLKAQSSYLIILADADPQHFTDNPHLLSRLVSMQYFLIDRFDSSDAKSIITQLSRQRGWMLSSRNTEFLAAHSPQQVSAVEAYFDRLEYLTKAQGKFINRRALRLAL